MNDLPRDITIHIAERCDSLTRASLFSAFPNLLSVEDRVYSKRNSVIKYYKRWQDRVSYTKGFWRRLPESIHPNAQLLDLVPEGNTHKRSNLYIFIVEHCNIYLTENKTEIRQPISKKIDDHTRQKIWIAILIQRKHTTVSELLNRIYNSAVLLKASPMWPFLSESEKYAGLKDFLTYLGKIILKTSSYYNPNPPKDITIPINIKEIMMLTPDYLLAEIK